jgi:uncharacterized protein
MNYTPPFWLPNGHFQSIYPSVFRKVKDLSSTLTPERLDTPDSDFLDVDWHFPVNKTTNNRKLVIFSHGLEGNSTRQYILGMIKIFVKSGYDCLAWNYRGCSGEVNKRLRFYHSGATDDLDFIVKTAIAKGYDNINLVGFSLGGNLTLKFLGEKSTELYPQVSRAAVFSVPLHLSSSSDELTKSHNWIYTKRFLINLSKKVRAKAPFFPKEINVSYLDKLKNLREFDDVYTAPIHGFIDAEDYYQQNSSLFFLENIKIPALIVNAQNDPFLSPECFPQMLINTLPNITFETPASGGHCGFYQQNYDGNLWSEHRALAWIDGLK